MSEADAVYYMILEGEEFFITFVVENGIRI